MSSSEDANKDTTPAGAERAAVRELVKAARARGEELTGPHGLLKTITKTVLESALEEEMTGHVGSDKHAVAGRNGANSRNGTRTKTVLTDNAGPVQVEVPRYRDRTFVPVTGVVTRQRQRRLRAEAHLRNPIGDRLPQRPRPQRQLQPPLPAR